MTPIDTANYFGGQLRLATHHYGNRTETVLMHLPSMRQFTVRPGADAELAVLLEEYEEAQQEGVGPSATGLFDRFSTEFSPV